MAGLPKRYPAWSAEGLPSQEDFRTILDAIDRQLRDLDGRMVAGDTAHTVNAAAIATVTRTVSSGGGGGGVTIHNSLHGLQGGLAPSEYYHFSELLHHELAATVGASGFSAYQTTLYGDYTEGHVIYAGAGGALSGDAGLIWLPTPNYLGIFGSGSTNSSPMTHIHVEASADDVSGNRTMAYFKNVNDGVAGFAQVVVEANLGGAWAALCQFGTNYTGIAQWAGKSVVYGSIGTTGLALAALSGAVEFWLYEQGYPVSNYTHVADITNAAGDIGLLPFADSSYILGSETGPKRWKDGSFDQIHTDALLEVTGAHGIDVDGWHIKDGGAGVITGGTNTFNITNGTAVLDVAAGATLDVNANLTVEADSAINQDLTSDAGPTLDHVHLTTSLGASDSYVPTGYLTALKLNATASFSGATAGVAALTGAQSINAEAGAAVTSLALYNSNTTDLRYDEIVCQYGSADNSFQAGVRFLKQATGNNYGSSIGFWTEADAAGKTYAERLRILNTQIWAYGLFFPQQATTVGAPAYVKGALYFDTTLNKLRVGGATGWQTVTSA